jgi:hypothetical protein
VFPPSDKEFAVKTAAAKFWAQAVRNQVSTFELSDLYPGTGIIFLATYLVATWLG